MYWWNNFDQHILVHYDKAWCMFIVFSRCVPLTRGVGVHANWLRSRSATGTQTLVSRLVTKQVGSFVICQVLSLKLNWSTSFPEVFTVMWQYNWHVIEWHLPMFHGATGSGQMHNYKQIWLFFCYRNMTLTR